MEASLSILASGKQPSQSSAPSSATEQALALAQALDGFSAWRANKSKLSEAIPDELWSKVFALETFYSSTQLRTYFNLSARQYSAKKADFRLPGIASAEQASQTALPKAPSSPIPIPSLCQVTLQKEPKAANANEKKSPYALEPLPSAKTLVVEFCRSDGQVMKIHTTQDSIRTLMQTFLGGE